MYRLTPGLGQNEHLKVNFEVFKCTARDTTLNQPHDSPTTTHKPPLLKNVLGENIFSSLQDLFVESQPRDGEVEIKDTTDPCKEIHTFNFLVDRETLFWIIVSISVLLLLVLTLWIAKKISQSKIEQTKARDKSMENVNHSTAHNDNGDAIQEVKKPDSNENVGLTASISKNLDKKASLKTIPLYYQARVQATKESNINTAEFLSNTMEKMFSKLDKFLLKGSTSVEPVPTQSQATIATPRLARRPLPRRQRVGSSPSLPAMSTSDNNDPTSNEKVRDWNKFKTFSKELAWKEPNLIGIDDSKCDRTVQRLVHYYQRVCPMNSDHWNTTTMITNYVLFLLKSEMKTILCSNGCRFIQFMPTGSMKEGTKVGRPNQFDILMLFQPSVNPSNAIVEDSDGNIPPGQLLISADIPKDASIACKQTTGHVKINNEMRVCLSSKEFSRSASELVDAGLQMLYTKSRSLMDRLSFQIKRSPTPNIIVAVDTRALVGLGFPEIKICISPALLLPLDGWYQPIKLYATPPTEDYQYKHSTNTQGAVHPDYLWQINFDDFHSSFTESIDAKMNHAGIESCHQMSLLILKSLLTNGNKNKLLDKGMFQSLHISTVLDFLLLESSPKHWTMEQLGDRFSDIIHFLRASFSNGRLPNFFVNNPHLAARMPFVATNQLLVRQRQQNMLNDMRRENLDKCLEYLQECLRESGLQQCVKDEYSNEMWEYEFFVF